MKPITVSYNNQQIEAKADSQIFAKALIVLYYQ